MKKIQLSIPEPCHENWDEMTPDGKGKFCASCQKPVIDFTNMTERQVAEFFRRPGSSTCGRFLQDQLNRDLRLSKKRIPWIKYFFQITLPAFLLSMKSNAQKSKASELDTTYCTRTMGFVSTRAIEEKSTGPKSITGQIVDMDGNKIAFGTILIKNSNIGTQSDAEGKFQLQAPPNSILAFSAVGYRSKEIAINEETRNVLVRFEKDDVTLSGEVVVVGYTARKKSKPFPVIKKVIDTAFNKFSVYPNPTQANSTITIDLRKLDAGDYKISIIGASGDIIQTEEKEISVENKTVTLFLKDVGSGTYFIRVLSRKTGVSYSKKIIIQLLLKAG